MKVTPYLLPLLSLTLTLAGCGTLADRREARQTNQALPAPSATIAPATLTDMPDIALTATATDSVLATEPASGVEATPTTSAPVATPVPPTTTVAAPADTAGADLLTLLDQWGADLEGEDAGAERDLP
jgi:hypothetical protein